MMRKWLKRFLWKLIAPILPRLIARYAADIVASVCQEYKSEMHPQEALDGLALLLTGLAHRKELYEVWQEHGCFLYPNSYMSPLPDLSEITDAHWTRTYSTAGIDMRFEAQQKILAEVFPLFADECSFPSEPTGDEREFYLNNKYFESIDAEVLHCFIRHFTPRRIIEGGSGHTTKLIAAACRINAKLAGVVTEFTAIDPQPRIDIGSLDGVTTRHFAQRIEEIDADYLHSLEANDILFIDSSHVARIGGDVLHIILNIVPQLKAGVIVHFHDIFLPFEYPKTLVLEDKRFWNEQYLLHAFLAYNNAYEVVWASHFMHQRAANEVRACFGNSGGSSFWIRRKPTL